MLIMFIWVKVISGPVVMTFSSPAIHTSADDGISSTNESGSYYSDNEIKIRHYRTDGGDPR